MDEDEDAREFLKGVFVGLLIGLIVCLIRNLNL
jgi:hypothetical protein